MALSCRSRSPTGLDPSSSPIPGSGRRPNARRAGASARPPTRPLTARPNKLLASQASQRGEAGPAASQPARIFRHTAAAPACLAPPRTAAAPRGPADHLVQPDGCRPAQLGGVPRSSAHSTAPGAVPPRVSEPRRERVARLRGGGWLNWARAARASRGGSGGRSPLDWRARLPPPPTHTHTPPRHCHRRTRWSATTSLRWRCGGRTSCCCRRRGWRGARPRSAWWRGRSTRRASLSASEPLTLQRSTSHARCCGL